MIEIQLAAYVQALPSDIASWFKDPTTKMPALRAAFEKLGKFATGQTQISAVKGVSTFIDKARHVVSHVMICLHANPCVRAGAVW